MSSQTKQSAVWEYFTLNLSDESKVSCSVCAAVVSRGGKETKNFNTSRDNRGAYCYAPFIISDTSNMRYQYLTRNRLLNTKHKVISW